MSSSKILPTYRDTPCGYKIFPGSSMEAFASALQYKPREDDLFVVTYPKSGTLWVQYIVSLIFRGGKPFESGIDRFLNSVFLEIAGEEGVKAMKRPGSIKTHFPYKFQPWSPLAKYIFVARNPKDVCVSLFHHTRKKPGYRFSEGKFDDFFELFMEGAVDSGDYFDFLLPWWEHRKDPNVLFHTYEDLKRDTRGNVLRIAEFIHPKYKEDLLSNDGSMLNEVLRLSSFTIMRDHINEHIAELAALPPEVILNHPDFPEGMKKMFAGDARMFPSDSTSASSCRKGVVGDWNNHLSAEQSGRLEEKFKERTKGTDIPKLWEGDM